MNEIDYDEDEVRVDGSEAAGWHLRHEERDGELVTVPVYHQGREVDI